MGNPSQAQQVQYKSDTYSANSLTLVQNSDVFHTASFSPAYLTLEDRGATAAGSSPSFDNGTGIFINQAEIVAADIPGRVQHRSRHLENFRQTVECLFLS